MADKKSKLSDRLSSVTKKKETKPVVPKAVIQEAKVSKKQRRPTYKQEGVKYERIFTQVPEGIKERLDVLRATKFRKEYKTQSEVILRAISEFLEKYE